MLHRDKILRTLFLSTVVVAGCGRPPRVNGAAGAPPSPSVTWQPPANAVKPEPLVPPAQLAAIPPDLADRVRQLTISDVVDIALRNNPATRASWSQARAAAFTFGSERGQYYPTVNATTTVGRSQTPATTTRPAGKTTSYGPSVSLTYLVLDFGGRSGSIERARQELFAANLTHNSTIQNVVLQA